MKVHLSQYRPSASKNAFTLIELLVVIAIISILAAILFPVFSSAREKARQSSCASNMKQLGLAFIQYTQDYDEYLPGCADGPGGNGKMGGWVYHLSYDDGAAGNTNAQTSFDVTKGTLYTYTTSRGIYVCPDDNQGQLNGLSYAMNECVTNYVNPSPTGVETGLNTAKLDDPGDIMLLCEEAAGEALADTSTMPTTYIPNSLTGTTDDGYLNFTYGQVNGPLPNLFSTRHNGGSEVLFCDGHVKWLNQSNLYSPDPTTGSGTTWTLPYYSIMTGDTPTAPCL